MLNNSKGTQPIENITTQQTENAINTANTTIDLEIQAIKKAKEQNQTLLPEIIKTIATTKGRTIITGIGKSGHIGKKIAATFASTGTPAFFVHSTEALHGDSGMFTENDTAILISHSGTTSEVVQLATMLKERKIKTIAATKNENTPLAKTCDLLLKIQVDTEADPLNLAPTSSTTVTLVLGDAIATALMNIYEFTPQDFKLFHPGGALGNKLSGETK